MIIYDEDGKISLGDLQDYQSKLEELKEELNVQMQKNDLEEELRIWYSLKQIARDLEDPRAMNLPYARRYYPLLIALSDQIRKQLQIGMAGSELCPKSWRLFRVE